MKTIPPEIINNVVEILSYCAAALVGWIAKILTGKPKSKQK